MNIEFYKEDVKRIFKDNKTINSHKLDNDKVLNLF